MTIEREELIKAAEAVRARAARQKLKEMTTEQLEAAIRSSPILATVPNPPKHGEPITDAHLEAAIRNCQIAEALGIEI